MLSLRPLPSAPFPHSSSIYIHVHVQYERRRAIYSPMLPVCAWALVSLLWRLTVHDTRYTTHDSAVHDPAIPFTDTIIDHSHSHSHSHGDLLGYYLDTLCAARHGGGVAVLIVRVRLCESKHQMPGPPTTLECTCTCAGFRYRYHEFMIRSCASSMHDPRCTMHALHRHLISSCHFFF